jgi:hypothetical protein
MKPPRSIEARMVREVRKVEAEARTANVHDAGTGQTIIKLHRHQPPLRTLLDAHKIGAIELQAAEQILLAVTMVSTRPRLAAAVLEHVSHGRQGDNPWPAHIALVVHLYQGWQNHWSDEWKLTRNPMLEVIWSAVVDERPISVIAEEIDYSRKRTQRAIIAGLRHYAAWAGMVHGSQRQTWVEAAHRVFERGLPPTGS